MGKDKKQIKWCTYLFQTEGSETECRCRIAGACKTFFWLGVSILMGMGVAQLT